MATQLSGLDGAPAPGLAPLFSRSAEAGLEPSLATVTVPCAATGLAPACCAMFVCLPLRVTYVRSYVSLCV